MGVMALARMAEAQYDAQFSQYFNVMGYYNPGYAGVTGDMNMIGMHRQQWVGMPGAPQSTFVLADRPFQIGNTTIGTGFSLFTETIGLFQNSHISGQFAYKQKLFGGTLSIGFQPSIASVSFDGSKVHIPESDEHDAEDEAIPTSKVDGMTFDLNAGVYFTHKKFYVGIASTHVMEPEFSLDENITTYIGRAYNLTGGYNIQLKNPLFELQPSVFLKTDLQSFQADITGRLLYDKMFSGGLSWRMNESVVVFLGAMFSNIEVGYAYDLPISPILKASSGSHEIMLRYRMKLDKPKTGNYRHKSVRIL
ncbi:membrane protein [Bacteroidia bacterium]|nr:membrane protein [Bacteroidia bacterium]